jgi:hypothetical protein
MAFRHFKRGSVVRAFRRYGDFMSPAHVRGLGDPLAEATADDAGNVGLEHLPAGCPLWIAGEGIDGSQRAVSATAPGHWVPGPESVPADAARQAQSSNANVNAIADERPDVPSTASTGATGTGPRRGRVPFDPAKLAKSQPERKPKNPPPRHHRPQMGEEGGPPVPRHPSYDDDYGPAAA